MARFMPAIASTSSGQMDVLLVEDPEGYLRPTTAVERELRDALATALAFLEQAENEVLVQAAHDLYAHHLGSGEVVEVGMHECVTCTRCACTFAVVHPACPRCSQEKRVLTCSCDRTYHDWCPEHGLDGAGLGPSGKRDPKAT